MKASIYIPLAIVALLALSVTIYLYMRKHRSEKSSTSDKTQPSTGMKVSMSNSTSTLVPTTTFNIQKDSSEYNDYYFVVPLQNMSLRVLADTDSSLFVVNVNNYDSSNLKQITGPMNKVTYLGIAAVPQAWFQDQVANLNNYPAAVCAAQQEGGSLPNILGLAETYHYGANQYFNGFVNQHQSILNITFDLLNNKLTMNDPETNFDYNLERNHTFSSLFSTSFYCVNLQVGDSGQTIPVVFDTGMSMCIANNLTLTSNNLELKQNGKTLFSIPPDQIQEMPSNAAPNQAGWQSVPFLILSNAMMMYPLADTSVSYKLSFEANYIRLKLLQNTNDTMPMPTLTLTQKNNLKATRLSVKALAARYAPF